MHLINNLKALGTLCNIEIFDCIPKEEFDMISIFLKNEILDFEREYSRFDPKSLISKLNYQRKLLNPSHELLEIIKLSDNYFKLTHGLFDIKLGRILAQQGYGVQRNFSNSDESCEIVSSDNLIELKGDFEIDLGGIGKSYLIYKISKILSVRYKIKFFILNFGGDIYVSSEYEQPIEIHLENPIKNNEIFKSILLKNQAVCGSSPFKRVWVGFDGNTHTHLINKNKKHVNNAAFVIAPSVIDADVYATCLCLDPQFEIADPKIKYIVFDQKGAETRVKY